MREQTNPSIKELVEEQGLTVRQLRTTLQRLENQGYGNLGNILLFGIPSPITIVKRMLRKTFR